MDTVTSVQVARGKRVVLTEWRWVKWVAEEKRDLNNRVSKKKKKRNI